MLTTSQISIILIVFGRPKSIVLSCNRPIVDHTPLLSKEAPYSYLDPTLKQSLHKYF